jgi:excisionase family DNA binding protein
MSLELHTRRNIDASPSEKRLYTIKESCAVVGLGPTSIYKLLKTGALKAVKVGSLTRIRSEDLEAWLAALQPRVA